MYVTIFMIVFDGLIFFIYVLIVFIWEFLMEYS